MRTQLRTALALGAFALSSPACVDVDELPLDDDESEGEITPLTGARDSLYGVFEVGTTWQKDLLKVCWMDDLYDNSNVNVAGLRSAGKDVVLKEWNRVSRLRFDPTWGRCSNVPDADIRIGRMRAAKLGSSAIGTDALAIPVSEPTMRLNFNVDVIHACSEEQTHSPNEMCREGNDDDTPIPPPDPIEYALDDAIIAGFEHTILHEFGHALGLRHEMAHPENGCTQFDEELDPEGYDGEPLWSYDSSSIMSYCNWNVVVGVGDIQALNTLYPGVVALFAGDDLTSSVVRVGPGVYTATAQAGATHVATLGQVSSIIVPPGFRAKLCSSKGCGYLTSSERTLSDAFNNHLVSVTVEPWVIGADLYGYGGTSERFGLGTTTYTGFLTLGNDTMSSVFVPLTRAATVYASASLSTPNSGTLVGGSMPTSPGPVGYKLPLLLDNQISRISVSARVATFTGSFTGAQYALGIGTFKVSAGHTWLTAIQALAISGVNVRACTEEGSLGQGAGTCWNVSQSLDLGSPHSQIRYLKISAPLSGGF
jgi:hypothetical protein